MENLFIGRHDASTVDLRDQKEVKYWLKRFSISEEELREIVARVGTQVDDVVKEIEPGNRPTYHEEHKKDETLNETLGLS